MPQRTTQLGASLRSLLPSLLREGLLRARLVGKSLPGQTSVKRSPPAGRMQWTRHGPEVEVFLSRRIVAHYDWAQWQDAPAAGAEDNHISPSCRSRAGRSIFGYDRLHADSREAFCQFGQLGRAQVPELILIENLGNHASSGGPGIIHVEAISDRRQAVSWIHAPCSKRFRQL